MSQGIEEHILYVGTFNSAELYTLKVTYDNCKPSAPWNLEIIQVTNAPGAHAFLALANDQSTLYATTWTEKPSICAYRVASSNLELLNSVATRYRSEYLVCSTDNVYSVDGAAGGNFSINHDGSINDASYWETTQMDGDVSQLRDGRGVHFITLSADRTEAFIADTGRNVIYSFLVNGESGVLEAQREVATPKEGDAPRYCWCHPELPYLYIMQERANRVDTYHRSKTHQGITLTLVHSNTLLPQDEPHQHYWGSEVRLGPGTNPKYLYASTRGEPGQTRGWITIWNLVNGIPENEPIFTYQTRTSGGRGNAIEVAPFPVDGGEEVIALTCSEMGLVMVLTFDGYSIAEVASLQLEPRKDGLATGAAAAVWRR